MYCAATRLASLSLGWPQTVIVLMVTNSCHFLQVYEAVINKGKERVLTQELSSSEKKRRVVLKRVNLDGSGVRNNFLQGGTMARVKLETVPHWLAYQ